MQTGAAPKHGHPSSLPPWGPVEEAQAPEPVAAFASHSRSPHPFPGPHPSRREAPYLSQPLRRPRGWGAAGRTRTSVSPGGPAEPRCCGGPAARSFPTFLRPPRLRPHRSQPLPGEGGRPAAAGGCGFYSRPGWGIGGGLEAGPCRPGIPPSQGPGHEGSFGGWRGGYTLERDFSRSVPDKGTTVIIAS